MSKVEKGNREMIFQRTWQAVMDGTKTQTRRLVKEGDVPIPLDIEARTYSAVLDANGRTRYQIRKLYAVQPGRTQKAVGKMRLMAIRRERLQEISENDAKAEGVTAWHNTTIGTVYKPEFHLLWDSINTKPSTRWQDNPVVWVLEFEVELPKLSELRGIAPNAMGDLTSEEFVWKLRDEWDAR